MEITLERLTSDGQSASQVLPLSQQRSYTFGRKHHNDVVLDCRSVSRTHFVIHHNSDGLFAQPLNSSNGLIIDGVKHSHGFIIRLNNDDLVQIGRSIKYRVRIKPLVSIIKSEDGDAISESLMTDRNGSVQPECELSEIDISFEAVEYKIEVKTEIEDDSIPRIPGESEETGRNFEAMNIKDSDMNMGITIDEESECSILPSIDPDLILPTEDVTDTGNLRPTSIEKNRLQLKELSSVLSSREMETIPSGNISQENVNNVETIIHNPSSSPILRDDPGNIPTSELSSESGRPLKRNISVHFEDLPQTVKEPARRNISAYHENLPQTFPQRKQNRLKQVRTVLKRIDDDQSYPLKNSDLNLEQSSVENSWENVLKEDFINYNGWGETSEITKVHSACHKELSWKSDSNDLSRKLTRHIRTHTGEKQFSCPQCDKKFPAKSHLTQHLRTHTGETPYACSFCDYKCSQESNLTRNLRKHTGEKPYACSFCDYKCSDKSSLTMHLRTHTGEEIGETIERKHYSFCE